MEHILTILLLLFLGIIVFLVLWIVSTFISFILRIKQKEYIMPLLLVLTIVFLVYLYYQYPAKTLLPTDSIGDVPILVTLFSFPILIQIGYIIYRILNKRKMKPHNSKINK